MVLVGGCTQNQEETIQENEDLFSSIESDNTQSTEVGVVAEKVVVQGSQVKVEYRGTFPDTGEVFDQSEGRGPLEFTAGIGQMIKGFDAAVLGMKLNEEKTVTIPPEDAYGELGDETQSNASIELSQLPPGVKEGDEVPLPTGENVKILKIQDDTALFYYAHPLAGKTLQFWIKVVDIQ